MKPQTNPDPTYAGYHAAKRGAIAKWLQKHTAAAAWMSMSLTLVGAIGLWVCATSTTSNRALLGALLATLFWSAAGSVAWISFKNLPAHWRRGQGAFKHVIKDLYQLKVGGTVDTLALLCFVAAAIGTTPLATEFVPTSVPALLAAASASYFAYRVLRGVASSHLLDSAVSFQSDHSPMMPGPGHSGFLIGYSTDTGEPIYVDDEHAMRHFFIIGMTGVGKTVLGLLLMFQQIMRGGGLLFIDGKLESDNIKQIWYYCQMAGRPQDLLVINPGDPKNSHTYNPILYGDPDEVAARILALIPSTENNPGADHYKQEANQGVTTLVAALQRAGLRYNMIDLSVLLMNANALLELERRLAKAKDGATSEELKNLSLFLDKFRAPDPRTGNVTIDITRLKNTFGGIGGRLYMFGTGKFGKVMNTYDPDVKLYEAIRGNKIVYVALPTMGKNEAANNFGKMVIGDLRTAISWLQALPEPERPWPPFLAFMDEQGSYANAALARPYEQARSARVILCGAIQTFANLKAISDEFAEMVTGNSWTKLYFKLESQETATEAADLIGMEMGILRTLSGTVSASQSATFLRATPESSNAQGAGLSQGEREQEQYRVAPDDLKELSNGEVIMTFGGRLLYDIRVPRIVVTPAAAKRFGNLMLTRRRPASSEEGEARFFVEADRFLSVNSSSS